MQLPSPSVVLYIVTPYGYFFPLNMQVHAANLGIKTFTQPVKCLIKDRRKQKCKYFFFLTCCIVFAVDIHGIAIAIE